MARGSVGIGQAATILLASAALSCGCRGGLKGGWFGGNVQDASSSSGVAIGDRSSDGGVDRPAAFAGGVDDGRSSRSSGLPADGATDSIDEPNVPVSTLTINGETITTEDVLKPLRKHLAQRADTMPTLEYRRYLSEAIESGVRLMARDALLYHEASKNLTDKERESIGAFADQRIRDRVNTEFAGRQSRYEESLAHEGLTLTEDRERTMRELIIARWLRMTISPKIADPTREQLWQLYESYKDSYSRAPRRKMQLIEVSVLGQLPPGVSAPSDDQLAMARTVARQRAANARQAILGGKAFSDVARDYSDGLHARNGGEWGWVMQGSVREKWEPAVAALFMLPDAGTASDVIETPDAFFVVLAAEIDDGYEPDFESLQPDLVERYRDAQFKMLVDQWVDRLQKKANIQPRNINRFLAAVARDAPSGQTMAAP